MSYVADIAMKLSQSMRKDYSGGDTVRFRVTGIVNAICAERRITNTIRTINERPVAQWSSALPS